MRELCTYVLHCVSREAQGIVNFNLVPSVVLSIVLSLRRLPVLLPLL